MNVKELRSSFSLLLKGHLIIEVVEIMPDKKITIVILLLFALGLGYGVYQYSQEGFDFGPTPEIQKKAMTVKVYFNNSELNPEMEDCSKVFSVEREVPKTKAVATAALKELFKGPTSKEKEQGYTSWFGEKSEGILKKVIVQEKTAYINLEDIREAIPGANSSCGGKQLVVEIENNFSR